AYHEGGHALVASLLPHVDPVHRVTITPRGRSLGVTQFRPLDDRRNYRRAYLLERLAVGLGGRTAEEIACEDITSGAQNDLQQVTRMARVMVSQLGMADELGPEYFGGGVDGLSDQPGVAGGGARSSWAPTGREFKTWVGWCTDAAVHLVYLEGHESPSYVGSEPHVLIRRF